MAIPKDIQRLKSGQDGEVIFVPPPKVPEAVKRRFPEMLKWEEENSAWAKKFFNGIKGRATE